MDNDRPPKDDLPERRMDPRRVPFNPNRETAFSRWAKQRDNRSTNIEYRRPQTQDEIELAEMREYLLGVQNNEAWRYNNSVLEKMLGRVLPPVGSIAHDAGVPNVRGVKSRSPKLWAYDDGTDLHLPEGPLHPPLDAPRRNWREDLDSRIPIPDPAEQIVDDVIQGKQ